MSLFLAACLASGLAWAPAAVAETAGAPFRVERLAGNPIVRPEMLPGSDGENINGPSLIRVPTWVKDPLGRYYLYFAHHAGRHIRLAYADSLAGPWQVHAPGVLGLAESPCEQLTGPRDDAKGHVASPDVHVDQEARRLRLYFHCPVPRSKRDGRSGSRQVTLLALSNDGLRFEVRPEPLGPPYFRVFQWQGEHYALDRTRIYRSPDGLGGFARGPQLLPDGARHGAVHLDEPARRLFVFYSQVGDAPERILLATVDLSRPWLEWRATPPVTLLEPELPWEGASLQVAPSTRGIARRPVRELRDPAIFVEEGALYLLYAVAGESGIAITRLHTLAPAEAGGSR